jgi:peptidoglycan/LPS O-acetylase OafA/YrhL
VKKLYLDLNETTAGMSNIPGLDGVRAISILLVMLSHSGFHFIPGVLGVTIFFFLSGFLITSLLLDEYGKHGTIDIPKFYARRVLRLYPPLLVYVAIVLAGLLLLRKEIDPAGLAECCSILQTISMPSRRTISRPLAFTFGHCR